MNHHAPLRQEVSPVRMETMAAERAAFLSLAKTQKRLSWTYYRWAIEAERDGNLVDYRRYRATSDQMRRDAHAHIRHARLRSA
jgi:hypothetical protein